MTTLTTTIGAPDAADVTLADAESLSDFESDVRDAFGKKERVVVDLAVSRSPGEGVSLPEAARAVVRAARLGHGHAELFVRTEAALAKLTAIIGVGEAAGVDVVLAGLLVRTVVADIIAVKADAVTNASNTNLHLGSGVSGAIRRAASTSLQRELDGLAAGRTIKPGDVVVTSSHGLPHAQHIVHAATADGSVDSVADGYQGALAVCRAHHIASLVVPALGTGVGGLPIDVCAGLLREAVEARADTEWPRQLIVALWSAPDHASFVRAFT